MRKGKNQITRARETEIMLRSASPRKERSKQLSREKRKQIKQEKK